MDLLHTITRLSHEFGSADYVKGGGGNTSVKSADTLWVKPSGTTLGGLTPERFVALDRAKLARLYAAEPPAEPAAREALVKDLMTAAVRPDSSGRPSVEAPLHDSFSATYVVHTHPTLVNGLTCSRDGAEAAQRLFPDALWVEYIDPGYTLCMDVRRAVLDWKQAHGREPGMVLLKNHGVFVAGQTPDEIRAHYTELMDTLGAYYEEAGLPMALHLGPVPDPDELRAVGEAVQPLLADGETVHVAAAGRFETVEGPLTPDHIVYAKSTPYKGPLNTADLDAFRAQHGWWPRVVETPTGVFGIGLSDQASELALELALDAAVVAQLAPGFGGVEFMTDAARDFIDHWEVEAYRRQQMSC